MLAGLVAVVVGAAGAGARPGLTRTDRAESCNEYTPAAFEPWLGSGSDVTLDVLVALDGVSKADALAIVETAQEPYDALNITLVPQFRKVQLTSARAEEQIAAVRESLGGTRPAGTDIVFILTAKDVSIASGDAVGYADCVGGIRYPNRAFAVAETIDEPESVAGLTLYSDAPAKTMAHEIGHLLGARHEHANCVEGASMSDVSNREPTMCTVMTTYLDFQSLNFATLEASIVRSFAEAYAAP